MNIGEDFSELYAHLNNASNYTLDVDAFFEELYDGDDETKEVEKKFNCEITLTKEKHSQLQYTYYYDIQFNGFDCRLCLEVENGINNGTQLNDYSFGESLIPTSRTANIRKDIILNEEIYASFPHLSLRKAQAVFPRYKPQLEKLYREMGYDAYMTGGGTDGYYNQEFKKIRNFGIHWEVVYETIEVDVRIV